MLNESGSVILHMSHGSVFGSVFGLVFGSVCIGDAVCNTLVQFQDQKWESASEMQCAFGLNNFGRVCSFLWGFVF